MYDYLVIDIVNLGYAVMTKENQSSPVKVEGKKVYQTFIRDFMDTLRMLETKFLTEGGEVVFLYDNYHSRAELAKMLKPLKTSESRKKINKDYKANRTGAKIEFYSSLDVIRSWAFTAPARYHTARIPGLEADDLVKPCIAHLQIGKPGARILLVTNDSDWCRYLSDTVQYLPEIHGNPRTSQDFAAKYGFPPSEEKVILYKILEGDAADHVAMVFPGIPPDVRKEILDAYDSTLDFLFGVHEDDRFSKYSSLVKAAEIDVKISYQVLSAKEVGLSHFRRIFTTGRNFAPLQKRWNAIFSTPVEGTTAFAFGGIRIPRRDPKPENNG